MLPALLWLATGALSALAQGTAQSDACLADPSVAQGTVCTYNTQAQDSTFVVPAGVTSLDITIVGGSGAASTTTIGANTGAGAAGAQVVLSAVPVAPTETLYLCASTSSVVADWSSASSVRMATKRLGVPRQRSSTTRPAVPEPPTATAPRAEVRMWSSPRSESDLARRQWLRDRARSQHLPGRAARRGGRRRW